MNLPFNGARFRKDSREAADAGLLIWRRNIQAFILFFAIPFLLFAILVRFILPGNLIYLSWIIIWLFKPLYDRLILHVISIRFFDKNEKLSRLLRGLGKTIFRGLAGDLLWRRFNPCRGAIMPVYVLEKNIKTTAGFKERKNNLKKGGLGFCVFLTIWGIAVEITLLAGGAIFSLSILELLTGQLTFLLSNLNYLELYLFFSWCVNIILVESIYVCMGFSVYINSRTETEGWDIEIIFKNIANKLKTSKNAALIILLLTFFSLPVLSHAEDYLNQKAEDKTPFETLNKILDSIDFGGVEETWGIRFKNDFQNDEEIVYDPDQLTRVQRIFAYLLRLFIIITIAGLLFYILFYFFKNKKERTIDKKTKIINKINRINAPEPYLLLEKAVNFHKQGELRLAWGYCAASSIQLWSLYAGIIFPANATENDCVNLIKKTADNFNPVIVKDETSREDITSKASKLEKIINTWIRFAYAGNAPPDGQFEEAVNFCKTLKDGSE